MLIFAWVGCPSPEPGADRVASEPGPRAVEDEWRCKRALDGARDVFPIGAAIRVAGPEERVFVLADVLDQRSAVPVKQAVLTGFDCGVGDGCARPERMNKLDPPLPVGDPLKGDNAILPSLALGRVGDGFALHMLIRQNMQQDCNDDGYSTDPGDQEAIDLRAFTWDHASGLGAGTDVAINDREGTCFDHGFNAIHADDGIAHACYTRKELSRRGNSVADDEIACLTQSADGAWLEESSPTSSGFGSEDHPTFAVLDGKRFVAAHQVNRNGPDAVQVHVLDEAGGETVVEFPSEVEDGEGTAQFPDLVAAEGKLALVYQDRSESEDARILYTECDRSTGCADARYWTVPEPIVDETTALSNDAKIPQLAVDGDRQWVAYTYDSDPDPGMRARIVAGTRCGDDPWDLEEVKPKDAPDDQSMEFGRPALVVNRDEHVVHVVFAELDDFTARADLVAGNTHNGDIFMCSRSYDPCE